MHLNREMKLLKTKPAVARPGPERLLKLALPLLLAGLWLVYALAEPLAPPDFYKYYFQGEGLSKFDFSGLSIPPLFPLFLSLLTGLGRLFSAAECFVPWAARILSLLAGLGTIICLERLAGQGHPAGRRAFTWLTALSPLILVHLSMPLSDMLFLFFVLAFFRALDAEKPGAVILFSLLAALTRYEGLLLLPPALLHALRQIPRARLRRLVLVLGGPLALAGVVLSIVKFNWLEKAIAYSGIFNPERGPLFFILNPGRLLEILAGNFLFFLPARPAALKYTALVMLFLLAAAGWRRRRREQPFSAWTSLYYLVFFLLGKGYLAYSFPGEIHTRRLLSFLVLFLLLVFRGWQIILVRTAVAFSRRLNGRVFIRACFAGLLLIVFSHGHRQALAEVRSIPDRGAYLQARYFINRPGWEQSTLFYLDRATFSYYLGREPRGFFPAARHIEPGDYLSFLQDKMTGLGLRRVAFNFYLVYPDARASDTRAKIFLVASAGNRDLWAARPLYYRGGMAACIVFPRFITP